MTTIVSEHNTSHGSGVESKVVALAIPNSLCANVVGVQVNENTYRPLWIQRAKHTRALDEKITNLQQEFDALKRKIENSQNVRPDLKKSCACMNALELKNQFDEDSLFIKGNDLLTRGSDSLQCDQTILAQNFFSRALYFLNNVKLVDNEQMLTLNSKKGQALRHIGLCRHILADQITDRHQRQKILKEAHTYYTNSLTYYNKVGNDSMVAALCNLIRHCRDGYG
jgi:hypothetical protein